jgi:hypothetical protein
MTIKNCFAKADLGIPLDYDDMVMLRLITLI